MALPKYKRFFAVFGTAIFGIFFVFTPASAQGDLGLIAGIIATIASVIIDLVGKLLIVSIELLIVIVTYNDFINAPAVERGWILVRDVANMGFLIIFIAIAYATILGVEKYEWKRLLPKLLLMAVAVNFSKTIVGIVIDGSQVVMITFVNGFKDIAAGNLVRGLGLADMLTLRSLGAEEQVTDTAIATASILAVVLLVIAMMTIGVIVLMFLVRIMYLWILTILAPLAFLMAATPGAEHLFREWFNKLVRYAFIGPIMAFWLWLSFSVMAGVAPGENLAQSSRIYTGEGGAFLDITGNTSAAITGISRSDQLLSYGISIALLLYSLLAARGMAIKGSGLADAALGKIKTGGIKLGKLAGLGVATGGIGAPFAAVGAKGAQKFAKTQLGKFVGRKVDDKASPLVTKGIGKAASKVLGAVGLGNTRLGLAAAAVGEEGIKFRTLKQGWSERSAEKEEAKTAESKGVARDVFNAAIDKEKTAYGYRSKMALVNTRAKKQADETDGTTEAFMKILEDSDDEIEQMAAIINLTNQNDLNEVNLTSKYAEDIHSTVLREMDQGINEAETELAEKYADLPQELLDALREFEKREADISDSVSVSKMGEFEQEMRAQGMGEEEIQIRLDEKKERVTREIASVEQERKEFLSEYSEPDQEKAEHAFTDITNLDNFKGMRNKFGEYKKMDTEIHREVALRTFFGDDDTSARFAAKIGNIGLEHGGFNSYGLAGYDEATDKYQYTRTTTPGGYAKQVSWVAGKGRNMSPANIFRGHPGAFRYEVVERGAQNPDGSYQDGKRTYHNELSDIGKRLFSLALVSNTDRNVSNLRADALAALVGGINISNYSDLFSSDIQKRNTAVEEFYNDLVSGYDAAIKPIIGMGVRDRDNAIGASVRRYEPKEAHSASAGTSAPDFSNNQSSEGGGAHAAGPTIAMPGSAAYRAADPQSRDAGNAQPPTENPV